MTDEPRYERDRIRDWEKTADSKCCGTCAWSRTLELKPFRVGCVEPAVAGIGPAVYILQARSNSSPAPCGSAAKLWTAKK